MSDMLTRPLSVRRTVGRCDKTHTFHLFRKVLIVIAPTRCRTIVFLPQMAHFMYKGAVYFLVGSFTILENVIGIEGNFSPLFNALFVRPNRRDIVAERVPFTIERQHDLGQAV